MPVTGPSDILPIHWHITQRKVNCRKNLTSWHGGDALVQAVAAQNNNTIVIVNSVGPLIVEPWIDHPNVSAVVWAGLAGEEAGNSITDVLYGDWNPSGRLPYTIAKNVADYPAQIVTQGSGIVAVPYTEGSVRLLLLTFVQRLT